MNRVERALISVSDKTGLVEFVRRLVALDIRIISTGGTARTLREAGIPVTDVSEVTGFPEILGGRVKSMHPKIHGGILAKRDDEGHMRDLAQHCIKPIELVVANFYPFVETLGRPGATLEEAVEQIDIGGPAMLAAAAKNHAHVVLVPDPGDYDTVACLLEQNSGTVPLRWRMSFATTGLRYASEYYGVVAKYLEKQNV
ncbi:MAG: IMP cyclohydrolase [Parcubacteria group bacterium]|nr:IMP cyclohydrolase [Parcubacteria group bacterium]